jgi:AcrR family transcriptional regulator
MSIKKGENRSVRHTKKRIRDGLLDLMRQKPIQDISVRELTDHIDLNRGTFYFHYRDIYDLLSQIEDDLINQLQEVISPHNTEDDPLKILENLFIFLKENADFGSIILGSGGDMAFVERVKQAVAETLIQNWGSKTFGQSPIELEFFDTYLINGFLGIVQLWYRTNMERPPHDMALFASQIITGSFAAFNTR